jgi:hypothetical protein
MKDIRILTFKLVSLTVLIGSSSVLSVSPTYSLPDSSSSQDSTSNPNPPSKEKTPGKTSTPAVKTTQSDQQPKSEDGPSTPSVTNTDPLPVKSKVEDNSPSSIISFVTLFLSILNTAGIGTLFFLNKKINESISYTKKEVKSIDSKLSGDIKSLKSSSQAVENRIAKVDSDNQKNLSEIKRKTEDLQHTITRVSQKSMQTSTNRVATRERDEYSPSSSDRQSLEVTNNQPSYISRYNDRIHNFQDNYQLTPVDRESENYKLSRSAKTEDVILDKQTQGSYWLFTDNGRYLLVPKHTFKIRQSDLSDVQFLFECLDYREDNHSNFVLTEPAILTQQGSGTWQLKEKGKLQFG